MMHVNLTQWRDRTEAPVIVWAYVGFWELQPVAVDDSHEADIYQEYASAFYAVNAYKTREELKEEFSEDYTPEEIDELYSTDRAARAGLPVEWIAEGVNEDGSDAVIYCDEETLANSHRESLEEAVKYLAPEDVAEIYRAILEARAEYDR